MNNIIRTLYLILIISYVFAQNDPVQQSDSESDETPNNNETSTEITTTTTTLRTTIAEGTNTPTETKCKTLRMDWNEIKSSLENLDTKFDQIKDNYQQNMFEYVAASDGKAYLKSDYTMSFLKAKEFCNNRGGGLTEITPVNKGLTILREGTGSFWLDLSFNDSIDWWVYPSGFSAPRLKEGGTYSLSTTDDVRPGNKIAYDPIGDNFGEVNALDSSHVKAMCTQGKQTSETFMRRFIMHELINSDVIKDIIRQINEWETNYKTVNDDNDNTGCPDTVDERQSMTKLLNIKFLPKTKRIENEALLNYVSVSPLINELTKIRRLLSIPDEWRELTNLYTHARFEFKNMRTSNQACICPRENERNQNQAIEGNANAARNIGLLVTFTGFFQAISEYSVVKQIGIYTAITIVGSGILTGLVVLIILCVRKIRHNDDEDESEDIGRVRRLSWASPHITHEEMIPMNRRRPPSPDSIKSLA